MTQRLYPAVNAYLQARLAHLDARLTGPQAGRSEPSHAEPAQAKLAPLISFIEQQVAEGRPVRLHFICTHNSRRSHLGQVWALAAAEFMGIGGVTTYSGGSEVTAVNPRALAALERAGCKVSRSTPAAMTDSNPRHLIKLGPDITICAYSKLLDDGANPVQAFAAVMTCTEADEKCPYLPGAARFSLPYEDPKSSDGTSEESLVYDDRCAEIATDMLDVMKTVRARLQAG